MVSALEMLSELLFGLVRHNSVTKHASSLSAERCTISPLLVVVQLQYFKKKGVVIHNE
jgi:hypothetical protein